MTDLPVEQWMETELWNFANGLRLDLNLPQAAIERIHQAMKSAIVAAFEHTSHSLMADEIRREAKSHE